MAYSDALSAPPAAGGGTDPLSAPAPNTGSAYSDPLGTIKATAPKAAKKGGGGGILGVLKTTLGEVNPLGSHAITNPVNLGKGMFQLGKDIVKAPVDVGEKVVNTGLNAAVGVKLPGDAFARDTDWSRRTALAELHDLPAIKGLIRGGIQTGRDVAGNVQMLANAPAEAVGQKPVIGNGFEKEFLNRATHDPLGTATNDLGTLALAALPVAGGLDAAGATGAAEGVRAAGVAAGRLAAGPADAYLHMGGDALEGLSQAHPVLGAVRDRAVTLAKIINNGRAGSQLAEQTIRGQVEPRDIARDIATRYKAVPGNDDTFGAGVGRARANQFLIKELAADPRIEPVLRETLARMGARGTLPTDAAVQEMVNPSPETRAAEAQVRQTAAEREARNLNGYGMLPGKALSEDQTLHQPITAMVDKEMAPLVKAHNQAAQTLRETAPGTPEYEAAQQAATQAQAALDAGQAAAERNPANWPAMVRDNVELAQAAHDQLVGRTKTGFTNEGTVEEPNVRQRLVSQTWDSEPVRAAREAAAARIEPMLDPHFYANLPAEGRPVHVIGDAVAENAPGKGRGSATRFRGTRAEFTREGQATAFTRQGQIDLEHSELGRVARNRGLANVLSKAGATTAREVLGAQADSMAGQDIYQALNQAKGGDATVSWEPVNPYASSRDTLGVKPDAITADTMFVPEPVKVALDHNFVPEQAATLTEAAGRGIGRVADVLTKYAYRNFLSLEPSYWVRRMAGNTGLLLANGVAPEDIPGLVRRAFTAFKSRDTAVPAVIGDRLNDEMAGLGDKVSNKMQAAPRFLDAMQREMLYLHFTDQGLPYEDAVARAMHQSGAAPAGLEKNVARRLVPGFSWGKHVGAAALSLAAEHPVAALEVANLARIASQPGGTNVGPVAEQLNPFGIFGIGGGGVNPVVRAALGAGTGFNAATGREVTHPGVKALTPQERAFYALNQFPLPRLLFQSPLSSQNQRLGRYQSGETKKTKPPFLPPVKTPLGLFGSAWPTALGVPQSPTPTG